MEALAVRLRGGGRGVSSFSTREQTIFVPFKEYTISYHSFCISLPNPIWQRETNDYDKLSPGQREDTIIRCAQTEIFFSF